MTSLPFANDSFDAVTSYLMLHHVIDWVGALVETARVLRPGGVFLGYDLTDTRLARFVHCVDGSPHRMFAAAELEEGLADAGFADVDVRTSAGNQMMRFRASKPSGGRHLPTT